MRSLLCMVWGAQQQHAHSGRRAWQRPVHSAACRKAQDQSQQQPDAEFEDKAAPHVNDDPRVETVVELHAGDESRDTEDVPPPPPGKTWAGLVASWPAQRLDPGLYVVATPIGNLGDITLRALSVLCSVNVILAEDTRHSRKLLTHFGIRVPLLSCHEHNEKARVPQLLHRLQEGEPMALISDAGTPGVSDPGAALIAAAIGAGVRVVPIPGAAAFLCALIASGLNTAHFMFIGFLPPKQGARRSRLQELRTSTATLAFYVPPHGLRATLGDMVDVLGGGRHVCVARELTKRHEELLRTDLAGALDVFSAREPRGEFCLIVEGYDGLDGAGRSAPGAGVAIEPGQDANAAAVRVVQQLVAEGVSRPDAAKTAARQLGLRKKDVYALCRQAERQGNAEPGAKPGAT